MTKKNTQLALPALMSVVVAVSAVAQTNAAPRSDTARDAALIQRGAYLARAGDCIACHTASGGKPFAGGLSLTTPIGEIYSTNITPDETTGIGNYSLDDFDKALRHGVTKEGYSLYPAMPYPSYANIKPADVRALYTYFKYSVPPVLQANRKDGIPWPLSMRWPLAVWRKIFGPDSVGSNTIHAVASADPNAISADINLTRGRYLVEGLGHCSACHTPRGIAFEEKALSDRQGSAFLLGAVVDGWFAKNLRSDAIGGLGSWTEHDIVTFLRSGRNAHSAAFGSMSEVVQHSTQYLNDDDLNAIAVYLKSLDPVNSDPSPLSNDSTATNALRTGNASKPGALLFINNCAACHRTNGLAYDGVFPQLAHSSAVNSDDPTSLIHVVLTGSAMPATVHAPTSFSMPGFAARLSDQQVADVLTFVRQSWGNRGTPVSSAEVGKMRKSLSPPEQRPN